MTTEPRAVVSWAGPGQTIVLTLNGHLSATNSLNIAMISVRSWNISAMAT